MTDDEFYQLTAGLIDRQRECAGLPLCPPLDIRRTLRTSKARLKELEAKRKELLTEMESPHNDYSFRTRGGRGRQVSPVEVEAERREKINRKLKKLEGEIATIKRVVICLQVLPPEDKSILERLYLRREGPLRVALDVGICERNLNGRAKKALWAVGIAYLTGWEPGQ